jgi:hypothetical protein
LFVRLRACTLLLLLVPCCHQRQQHCLIYWQKSPHRKHNRKFSLILLKLNAKQSLLVKFKHKLKRSVKRKRKLKRSVKLKRKLKHSVKRKRKQKHSVKRKRKLKRSVKHKFKLKLNAKQSLHVKFKHKLKLNVKLKLKHRMVRQWLQFLLAGQRCTMQTTISSITTTPLAKSCPLLRLNNTADKEEMLRKVDMEAKRRQERTKKIWISDLIKT